MSGFYLMHRGWMDHPVFGNEPYSQRTAWIWMIEAAAWKPTVYRVGTVMVDVNRGEFVTSLRILAGKWRWSKDKVRRFLMMLESCGMIRCESATGRDRTKQRITICNYEKFQDPRDSLETESATDVRQTRDRSATDAATDARQSARQVRDSSEPHNELSCQHDLNSGEQGRDRSATDAATEVRQTHGQNRDIKEIKKESNKDISADALEFYAAYPRKVAKPDALKAYAKARKKADHETIMAGLARYIRTKPAYADWAHPATWLNKERWLDEEPATPPVPVSHAPPRQLSMAEKIALAEARKRAAS